MLRNFLITSLRNLCRHKNYAVINILGLTVGLVSSISIFLWIIDEVSYDRFHVNTDRIYKVLLNNTYPDGKIETYPATPAKLKDAMVNEIPEVELAAQYSMESELSVKSELTSYNETGIFADPSLFRILNFPVINGNQEKPLIDIKSIAISEKLAVKLFNKENPIGKSVNLGGTNELIITSVFANLPHQSTLQFDFVASFDLYEKENPWTQHWQSGGTRTVVLLKSSEALTAANHKLADLIKKNCSDCTTSPFLFPLVKSRLYSEFENGKSIGGRIQQVYLLAVIALIILVMACINFTNLSTARATSRSREVGIRKSVGAVKNGLIFQFITESILLSFISLMFAIVALQLLLPFFNEVTSKSIELDFSNPLLVSGILGVTVFCGVLAGCYPAFILSQFNPAKVLKGETHMGFAGNRLRKFLVVVQFTTSTTLIIGSIAVYKQLTFISHKNLGFDKDNIIVLNQNEGIVKSFATIKNDLQQIPSVEGIAFGGNNIFTVPITTTDPVWKNKSENSSILFKIYRCDAAFIPTLNIKVQGGRNFMEGGQDASNYIINRKAAEVMGFTPEEAIGSELEMWNGKGKIVGITEDFHNDNLKFGIEPMIFMYSENIGLHYFIRLGNSVPAKESIAQIKKVFNKHNPDYQFEYRFLNDVFNNEYESEATIGKLSLTFTCIAIIISCLGLLGLASYNAEKRTKELGIRKVLGASVNNLVIMLCKDFSHLAIISLTVACTVSWYLIREYMADYTYHTEISWETYALTSLGMLVTVVLFVGFQSAKAAMTNPVYTLRKE